MEKSRIEETQEGSFGGAGWRSARQGAGQSLEQRQNSFESSLVELSSRMT